MKQTWRDGDILRIFEMAIIALFVIAALVWVAIGVSASSLPTATPPQGESNIQVFSYALPNRGWAPLTVYFSAFGTNDLEGKIVRYEWDLDGNGSFESDATAEGGYASYVYTKPRDYTITLRVTNDKGATATADVMVHVLHPASSNVDYWTIFNQSQVRKVEVEITQANWNAMMANPGEKLMVQADALVFGERVEQVGISPKGNSTLWFPGDKKPFKLDFNAYIAEQEYRNLKMLIFHNNFGDPAMLREKMAYDMMQFAGVPGGFTAYVELWVDITDDDLPPDFIGVYTMVERPDRKYLGNRFGRENDNGNLYKADAWFEEGAADLAYYGENIEDYPKPRGELAYALMYKDPEEADYGDIINLCYVIDGVEYATPEDFATSLESVFNVDGFLRYLAVIFLNLNFDQYPDTGNNYYIYNNPGTDKFEWIAWDMGNSWGMFGGDYDYPIFGQEQSIGPLQYRPLFTKVFQVEEYRQTYQAYLDLLIRNYFNEENIGTLARGWHSMIKPHLQAGNGDKMLFGDSSQVTIDELDNGLEFIIDLTKRRAEYVQGVLDY
ncbi:MAG: CotH kinase family protein [Anaerolineales bacterium]|nr:CotH kinase family protein [Chloroflexota bacterium]MBL6983454.1 CotH kinase family protein [Anaerolineales bacterium]